MERRKLYTPHRGIIKFSQVSINTVLLRWISSFAQSIMKMNINFYTNRKIIILIRPHNYIVLQQKKVFFQVGPLVVCYRLTYIKMFALTSSLRKPMLTSWHFGAGGDILGQNMLFWPKIAKNWNTLQNSRDPSMGRNFTWLTSECVLNKACDATTNDKIYL